MRVVEFANGKFAVKKGWWIFAEYLGTNDNDNYWWSLDKYIIKYAQFDTKEAACKKMKDIQLKVETTKRALKIINTHKNCGC
jgi:hypothetical protein